MKRTPKTSGPSAGAWVACIVLALSALGIALVVGRRWVNTKPPPPLPSLPNLSGKPSQLVERLKQAEASARAKEHPLNGVEALGRLYHANGYLSEAEACWRRLHWAQPREAKWSYYLADLRRSAGDYPEMSKFLAETVKRAPDYAPAWLKRAEYAFKTGDFAQAARDYRRRLELLPGDPYARLGLARVELQTRQPKEARKLIEELVHDVPNFSSSRNLYAEMLAADGDAEGARQQRWLAQSATRYREADDPWLNELNDSCFDPNRLFALATVEYQTERGDRGEAWLKRAVELTPNDPAGYEQLGDFYLKIDQAAKAREVLQRGIDISTTGRPLGMLYVNLSEAYRKLGQTEQALLTAQHGLAFASGGFELRNAVGAALADLGRHAEAIGAFQEALALNPGDADTNVNLGLSLLALSRRDDAIECFKRALVHQPTNPKALSLLGQIELVDGRLEEAAHYLRPLYEAHPGAPQARQLIALLELRSGLAAADKNESAEAERHYRAGIVANPNDSELQVNLGLLCLLQGRIPEALPPFEAYHRLQPGNPQSSLFLGQVYAQMRRPDDARRVLTEGLQLAERQGNKTTAEHCRQILQSL
jgi:tetratricopeptide (TPR) repeat protein